MTAFVVHCVQRNVHDGGNHTSCTSLKAFPLPDAVAESVEHKFTVEFDSGLNQVSGLYNCRVLTCQAININTIGQGLLRSVSE